MPQSYNRESLLSERGGEGKSIRQVARKMNIQDDIKMIHGKEKDGWCKSGYVKLANI